MGEGGFKWIPTQQVWHGCPMWHGETVQVSRILHKNIAGTGFAMYVPLGRGILCYLALTGLAKFLHCSSFLFILQFLCLLIGPYLMVILGYPTRFFGLMCLTFGMLYRDYLLLSNSLCYLQNQQNTNEQPNFSII